MRVDDKKVVGVIPARMASTRFYGKPLAKILGKEMLLWVWEGVKECRNLEKIVVATDHEDIEKFCQSHEIPCMMTSPEHKNCSERSNEVGERLDADFVVEIQGDEPTLRAGDVDAFIEEAIGFKEFDVVTQYTDLTTEQAHDPHNVKLVVGAGERALFFSRCPIPYNLREREVKYYKQIGLFFWRRKSLSRFTATPVSYLESIEDTHMLRMIENSFDIRLIYTPRYSVGVDVPEDIVEAEEFLRETTNA